MITPALLQRRGFGDAALLTPGTTPGTLWPNFHALAAATPNVTYDVSHVTNAQLMQGGLTWTWRNGVLTASVPGSGGGAGDFMSQYGTYLLIGGGLLFVVALIGSRK
jgi:hypothetical protein